MKQYIGLILGGIVPAVLLGIFGFLQKASNKAGIGIGMYLTVLGLTITLIGIIVYVVIPDKSANLHSVGLTCLTAVFWAAAIGLIAMSISRYNVDIAKIVPLYNMNTLVAVGLGLWIFSEWDGIKLSYLIVGAILIVLGGTLVANS